MKIRSGGIIKLALFMAWLMNSLIIGLVLYFDAGAEHMASHFLSWLKIIFTTGFFSFMGYDIWFKHQQKSIQRREDNGGHAV